MNEFKILKRLIWLPLAVALLQGCISVGDSGSTLGVFGFASDTTAILFYELWEQYDGGFLDLGYAGT